jgi:hypothetical protein
MDVEEQGMVCRGPWKEMLSEDLSWRLDTKNVWGFTVNVSYDPFSLP